MCRHLVWLTVNCLIGIGMKFDSLLLVSTLAAISGSACAQSAPQTLDLNLPPNATAMGAAPAAVAKSVSAGSKVSAPQSPAVQAKSGPTVGTPTAQGSGTNDNAIVDALDSRQPACNDDNYGKPQVHGSVGVGVMAGNHVSGNYQTGSLQVTKALGSCEHPTGGVSFSINVSQGNFNNRRFRRPW